MSLTKHKEGSLRELWSISFPLMLSSLSVMAMLFVDRILLAKYSLEAFTASVSASTLGWAFIVGWLVLTSIDEVFVAQYNGAKKFHKFGEPVWQMIWLSLASVVMFLPLAIWGGTLFYGNKENVQMHLEYFYWMMLFGASFPLYGALTGFFVGQGKVKLITMLALATNLVNAGLDWVLIFGIEGIIPSLGVKGAAIATCTSEIFQVVVLLAIFLNKSNREAYGTSKWQINFPAMWQCIRIGSPAALFFTMEILAWAVYYIMLTKTSEKYITIAGICQSLIILFYFVVEGTGKGITAISGNLIGAKKSYIIDKSAKAGLKLHLAFFFMMLGILYFFPDTIVDLFLVIENKGGVNQKVISDSLNYCLLMVAFYIFFEGLRFVYAGVLTAAGDTLFLLFTGSFTIWIFVIIPVYFFVLKGGGSIELAQTLCSVYALIAFGIIYYRYNTGKWKSMAIAETH